MAKDGEVFVKGEDVTWDEGRPDLTQDYLVQMGQEIGKYGRGPFPIIGVNKADEQAAVSHPQLLTIKLDEKTNRTFSGWWFTHCAA